jgi:hypothetical protein
MNLRTNIFEDNVEELLIKYHLCVEETFKKQKILLLLPNYNFWAIGLLLEF